MIKPNAGQMRGFRIVRDPDGILFNSFDLMGSKYGYILTYGEGVPSIHNGDDWVPVLSIESADFEEKLQNLLIDQGMKIAQAASANPVYAELAAQMNIYAGATAAPADPSSAPSVTYYKS